MDYLSDLTQRLSARFGDLIPGVIGALLVLIVGFILARVIRKIAERLMRRTNLDERLGKSLNTSFRIDKFVGKFLYYLVVLITLMVVLNLLGVDSVLEPLQDMVAKFLAYIPNIIAAGIIGFAGYLIAQIGSEATGFISERLESYSTKVGLDSGQMNISKIVKQIVFIIIFIPILVIALETLNMSAISDPASEMLGSLLDAIPMILAAILLLALFYIVGKFATSFIADLLDNMGVNNLVNNIGLQEILGEAKFSKVVANVLFFFIMFLGVIGASDKLGLVDVSSMLQSVLEITGKVFFGLIILALGVYIANLAVKTLLSSTDNKWMAPVARFAIVGIFLAFALHTMGIAESIVNLAFGLTLGAIAVAFALSFGLGGRKAAGRQMQRFFDGVNGDTSEK